MIELVISIVLALAGLFFGLVVLMLFVAFLGYFIKFIIGE